MTMRFVVETLPHSAQRYPTVGDYTKDNFKCIHIRVSDIGHDGYEFLVAVHEMVEAFLAYRHGIKEEDIDAFDIQYEKNRKPGDFSEPGDDTRCPVFREHQIATAVEKLLAQEMGISWSEYSKAVDDLG